MSKKKYHVIFSGQILNGFDEVDVRNNLQSIFQEQVEDFFNKAPCLIQKNISFNHAQQLAARLERLGVKCELYLSNDQSENVEIDSASLCQESFDNENSLTMEFDHASMFQESIDHSQESDQDENFEDVSQSELIFICPACGLEQSENNACTYCGLVNKRSQDTSDNTEKETAPKKDVLQEYLVEMSRDCITEATTETETKPSGTSFLLKLFTVFVLLALFVALGWSFYFFACKKPWRSSGLASISIQKIVDVPTSEGDQLRMQSKKDTIVALKKALERKEKIQTKIKKNNSNQKFKLKNIPIPLLSNYIGKYVWVTCDNDSVHQGTLYAIYIEQVILKKPRFNLTIPINLSMIKTVEYDMSENEHDENAVEAYQAYKRSTEEALQNIPISHLKGYHGKNLRIHLYNGQVYEGVLSKFEDDTITLKNIVYGQMVSFVIRKESIQKIYF